MAEEDSIQADGSGPTGPGGQVGLPVGAKIGKYEVRERLAIGGQALVYKCHDSLLDRFVAIKQISTHLAEDPKFLQRFRREARILARLGAEIITIHELLEDEKGLFIVMEYVEGRSLEAILSETGGPVDTRAALQIIWRLAGAMHEVHSAGIIHRDLKPSNIIIAEGLRPRVTDFGVAASTTGQTSMVLGTTKYMAPELFSGGATDERVDMYSLGFIAYEMLIGRDKFNEIFQDVVRDKHTEALRWMKWHGNEQVQAPPACEVNPLVPKALSDIVAGMMAKNLHERFASMEKLGRSIKAKFSPRAKAEARRLKRRRRGKASAEETLPAAPAGRPDEQGEELELADEATPTAALPKRKWTLRTKLIVVGAVLACAIAGGVIIGVLESQRRQQFGRTVDVAFRAAMSYYDDADYGLALKAFGDVQTRFGKTKQAAKASVLELFCRGYIAVQGEQWQQAAAAENAVKEQLKKVQAARGDLVQWTRRISGDVEMFRQHRTSTWKFRDAMERAEKLFTAGRFAEAQNILTQKLRSGAIHLTDDQDRQLSAFRSRIELAAFRTTCNDLIREVSDLAAQGQFGAAEAAGRSAKAKLGSPSAGILGDADRKRLEGALAVAMRNLKAQRDYEAAMKAAGEAAKAGNKGAELAALKRANKIKTSPKLTERIGKLHSLMAYERGIRLKAQGNLKGARRALEQSLRYDKDSPARAALAELDRTIKRRLLLQAGDEAQAGGKFSDALSRYTEAEKLASDDALRGKIIECRYRIQLGRGDRLREEKKYDEAVAAYENARQVKPAAAPEIDARIAAAKRTRMYEGLIAAGDEALKQRAWDKAMDLFRKARDVSATTEADQRIKQTRYSQNVELGKEAMRNNDFTSAVGYFRIAQNNMDTEEVRKLIARAQQKKSEQTP